MLLILLTRNYCAKVTAKEGEDGVLFGTMHAGLSLHSAIGENMRSLSLSLALFIGLYLSHSSTFLLLNYEMLKEGL